MQRFHWGLYREFLFEMLLHLPYGIISMECRLEGGDADNSSPLFVVRDVPEVSRTTTATTADIASACVLIVTIEFCTFECLEPVSSGLQHLR